MRKKICTVVMIVLLLNCIACTPKAGSSTAEMSKDTVFFNPSAYRWDAKEHTLFSGTDIVCQSDEILQVRRIVPAGNMLVLLYIPIGGETMLGVVKDGTLQELPLTFDQYIVDIGCGNGSAIGLWLDEDHVSTIAELNVDNPTSIKTLYQFNYIPLLAFCLDEENVYLATDLYISRLKGDYEIETLGYKQVEGEELFLSREGENLVLQSLDDPSETQTLSLKQGPLPTKTIQVWGESMGEEIFRSALKAFYAKHAQYVLQFSDYSNEGAQQMLVDLASGSSRYDLYCITNSPGYLYDLDRLINGGYFAPFAEGSEAQQAVLRMFPDLQAQMTGKEGVCALPFSASIHCLEYFPENYNEAEYGPIQAYDSWDELLDTLPLDADTGLRLLNLLFQQHMLSADTADFGFTNEHFAKTLTLMRRGLQAGAGIGYELPYSISSPYVPYLRYSDTQIEFEPVEVYPLPTLDEQGRYSYTYFALAVNPKAEHFQEAMDFVNIVAAETKELANLPADESRSQRALQALCFADEDIIQWVSGGGDNAMRWKELQTRLTACKHTWFQTSFHMDILPLLQNGSLTDEDCMRLLQEKWEMYQKERAS